eukprot:159696_1
MDSVFSTNAQIVGVILTLLMLAALYRAIRYLIFNKELTIKDKHVFVVKENKNKTKKKLQKESLKISFAPYIRFGALACFIAYFTVNTLSLYEMFSFTITAERRKSRIVPYLLLFFCRIGLNSVFVSRLKHCFKDTIWMYSNKILYSLYGVLLILILLTATMGILLILQTSTWLAPRAQTIISLSLIVTFLDIAFALSLTYLFQKRVFELIASYYTSCQKIERHDHEDSPLHLDEIDLTIPINEDNTHSIVQMQTLSSVPSNHRNHHKILYDLMTTSPYENDASFAVDRNEDDDDDMDIVAPQSKTNNAPSISKAYNHTQLELVKTATQYTVLIVLSVLTSLCTASYAIFRIYWIKNTKPGYDQMNELFFKIQFSMIVDSFIHFMLLYLHFAFSFKLYQTLCYHKLCLHNLCLFCFTKRVANMNI